MYTHPQEYRNAIFFFIFIVTIFIGSLYTAMASAGPIVLGTELNTNGIVEYLCLGMGCENLPY